MKYINKEKLIKALNQIQENSFRLNDMEKILDYFGDTYYIDGNQFVLCENGKEIIENQIYKLP